MAAAAASILGRSVEFKSLLFRDERDLEAENLSGAVDRHSPGSGVWIRFSVKSFVAGDLSFETTVLLGVIGGRLTGVLGGVLLALPALWHGEWATLPFNVLCGFVAGQLRNVRSQSRRHLVVLPVRRSQHLPLDPAQSAQASPFRMADHVFPHDRGAALCANRIVALLCRSRHLQPGKPDLVGGRFSSTPRSVIVIGTELKIWNSVRIQIKLEEQERLLLHSRMEALQNQINPHFLFNTLNSVSSLVRFDPDTARELIIKLANILRRLLNSSDAFVPLREELEFIDNYLDIEVVRFGRDKLRVVKELEPSSLDTMVPSMLLQPLVENSIKHGLSSKIDGGSIYLRSRLTDSHLIIEVEDDGVGMGSANLIETAHGPGRNRHRDGQRGRAPESAIRRHRAHDHRQPRRQGNSGQVALAGPAGIGRDS